MSNIKRLTFLFLLFIYLLIISQKENPTYFECFSKLTIFLPGFSEPEFHLTVNGFEYDSCSQNISHKLINEIKDNQYIKTADNRHYFLGKGIEMYITDNSTKTIIHITPLIFDSSKTMEHLNIVLKVKDDCISEAKQVYTVDMLNLSSEAISFKDCSNRCYFKEVNYNNSSNISIIFLPN